MKKAINIYLYLCIVISYSQINFKPNSYLIEGNIIPLYENSIGKEVKEKLNNTDTDYYFEAKILSKNNNRFYVKLNNIKNEKKSIGWIDLKHLGVGLRNLNFNSVPIYQYSSYKSKKRNVKIHIESVIAKIINIDGLWLKVCFYSEDKKIIGWLSPKNQCYSLYTMCTAE